VLRATAWREDDEGNAVPTSWDDHHRRPDAWGAPELRHVGEVGKSGASMLSPKE
jgi:hypothetical protein